MGLDMYLSKRTCVKNWDKMTADKRITVTVKRGGKPLPGIDKKRISYVEEDIAYWRKANAIHSWFVKNVQGGVDDCGTYDVTKGQLFELFELVTTVLKASELVDGKIANGYTMETQPDGTYVKHDCIENGKIVEDPKVAHELLPTVEGFFFGSTDYDESYIQDLKDTKKALSQVLKDEGDGFQYHASW